MAGGIRQQIVEALWGGGDPFAGFSPSMPPDVQGWNSYHPYLVEAIDRYRPQVVVEIGVWKGTSVLYMAQHMRSIGCEGVVVAVDTFLGAADHWLDPANRGMIPRLSGMPLLYFVFMTNVAAAGLQDFVLPLPLDSINASEVLRVRQIQPTVLHLDAAHDYASVTADLTHWWPLLRPGGMLIADDYVPEQPVWADVRRAIDDFRARTPHTDFAFAMNKCRFVKPLPS